MAKFFNVEKVSEKDEVVELKLSFGEPAQLPQILPDALAAIRELNLIGGRLIKFNGPCAVAIGMALAHEIGHRFGAVAYFDPKISPGYVICITHDPAYSIGQQIA